MGEQDQETLDGEPRISSKIVMDSSLTTNQLPITGRKRVRTSTKNYTITDYFGSSPKPKGARMDEEWGSSADQEEFVTLVDGMGAVLDGLPRRLSQENGYEALTDNQGAKKNYSGEQVEEDIFADPLEFDECEEFEEIISNYLEQETRLSRPSQTAYND